MKQTVYLLSKKLNKSYFQLSTLFKIHLKLKSIQAVQTESKRKLQLHHFLFSSVQQVGIEKGQIILSEQVNTIRSGDQFIQKQQIDRGRLKNIKSTQKKQRSKRNQSQNTKCIRKEN
ncbi:unnamed protein product (macronuclear) [Paramecium tetraurelia]|uniref:Transmembrane protein n=1 Tax=Paramecium tetraurelia TaxID=5888 RepID=A0DNS3_PARTE|nr:uncharacterized protein GSPATT00018886001 [Paramecium tetraurelia]CAK84690.1 unnamed protein product [Paramecium tetraurelia]|eukprot:XP_001452087.1 hypothetical protein (macronuclear) [Paramecium tetraurelia strain d4-2]